MRKLSVGVIDVVAKSPSNRWYAKAMRANLASIMPQVVAIWCEQEGHDVHLSYRNGYQDMIEPLPDKLDIVFISAFTPSAHLSYALSNYYRSQGAVTVLGGPHARCYPEDAQKYFDYVLGFTDKELITDVLQSCEPQRPYGIYLSAKQQPQSLPGVEERWKYVSRLLEEAPMIKIVPMIGSLGCPYTCAFCVDSVVPYQPLDFDVLKSDLRFVRTKMKRPIVGWHDPNFGVRFKDYMGAIEEAIPPDSIDFIAESTLSLLSEENVQRMRRNGFKVILPGIESWFDMGNKSKTGKTVGQDKVEQVSEQVNMILSHMAYLQANFVNGLDSDEGELPFELTKSFLDKAPGSFPAFSMLTSFGRSAPLNIQNQRADRLIPVPIHFLDNNAAMNVRPKNYTWPEFYDNMIRLHEHAFSKKAIFRRFRSNKGRIPKMMNVLRAVSMEGWGKIEHFKRIRLRLDEDKQFRDFFEQETTEVPAFFTDRIKRDLGPMLEWLPDGAMFHDPHAYRKAEEARVAGAATA